MAPIKRAKYYRQGYPAPRRGFTAGSSRYLKLARGEGLSNAARSLLRDSGIVMSDRDLEGLRGRISSPMRQPLQVSRAALAEALLEQRASPRLRGFPKKRRFAFMLDAAAESAAGMELLHDADRYFRASKAHADLFKAAVKRHKLEAKASGLRGADIESYAVEKAEREVGDPPKSDVFDRMATNANRSLRNAFDARSQTVLSSMLRDAAAAALRAAEAREGPDMGELRRQMAEKSRKIIKQMLMEKLI
ncbi:hypothetical protein HYS54_04880 [Candidatus Micrarchaeota archaeon]|nr:hypothetical protein [Candidatus Micrarchaeota archaeon]